MLPYIIMDLPIFEQVRRYGVLEKLNSIMSGYGFHEDSHMCMTLKHYLLSIYPAGGEFYENFILDVVTRRAQSALGRPTRL